MEQDAAALQQVDEENELKAIAMRPKSSTGTSFLLPVEADIDTSPYASPLLTIHFADGPPLSIHKRLLDKCPNLSSACGNSTILHLANVPSSAGHVLTHYLFTGVYECLKPRTQCHKTNAAEFATAIRVYEVALEYELLELASLAGDEIEKLGARLPVLQLFDVLKDTLPNYSIDDMRLQSYLKFVVRPFIDNPFLLLGGLPNSADETQLFANTLFQAVIELCREKTETFGVIQDRNDGPASHPEHNTTHAVGRPPEHGLGTTSKKRRKRKQKKRKTEREAGHETENSSSVALTSADMTPRCNPTVRMNAKARRRAKRLQQFGSAATDRAQSAPDPVFEENDVEFVSQLGSPSSDRLSTPSSRQGAGSTHGAHPIQDNIRGTVALNAPNTLRDAVVEVDGAAMEYESFLHIRAQEEEYEPFSEEERRWDYEFLSPDIGHKE